MIGPYVIVCRAHSGGRVLSEAFIKNGIQMGNVRKRTKDTYFFAIRRNHNVKSLIEQSFEYPNMEDSHKEACQKLLRQTVEYYIKNEIDDKNKPFGWKFGETLFLSQIVMDSFPTAKIIHLIRDGRDVMLSRSKARFEKKIHESFNKLIIFGSNKKTHFLNKPFNEALISKYRNELEIKHWETCVKFGMFCRKYSNQFLEVKYEDLCTEPTSVLSDIFDFLDVPFHDKCKAWANQSINTTRIRKWKKLSEEELKEPLNIAGDTLSALGYL